MTMNDEDVFGRIKMGVNVDIKRSDGRIHSAVVSGINFDTRSVTVEWFERGETKGKEIELDAILSLNHDLAPNSNENSNGIPNKLSKYVPRPSVGVQQQQQQQQQQTNNRANNVVSASAANARTRKGRQTELLMAPPAQQQQPPPAVKQQQQMMPPPQPPPPQDDDQNEPDLPGKGGARGRRSNVVKEVEKLRKNREERRAKQAEIMEEKVALKNIDPGNPNWEFLSMIREYQEQVEFNPLQDGDAVIEHQMKLHGLSWRLQHP